MNGWGLGNRLTHQPEELSGGQQQRVAIARAVGVTVAAAQILPQAVPDFPAPEVSLSAIALAFGVSLAIGLVAGGYPANRAARMRPIEALRYQ